MADKGFNVQDLFAPFDVHVNIPAFFSKKTRLTGASPKRQEGLIKMRLQ
jgi:hypothetical protein